MRDDGPSKPPYCPRNKRTHDDAFSIGPFRQPRDAASECSTVQGWLLATNIRRLEEKCRDLEARMKTQAQEFSNSQATFLDALTKSMKSTEAAQKRLECPNCMTADVDVSTTCDHAFCEACIVEACRGEDEPQCPVCRRTTYDDIAIDYHLLYL